MTHPSEQQPNATRNPRRVSWRRVLAVGAAAFGLWLLLDATTLQHNAQASPVGTRRSVALALLKPIAGVARITGISHVGSWANDALGRPPLDQQASGPQLPRYHYLPVAPSHRSATPTTVPTPSPATPLRVLILGDSLGLDVGQQLEGQLAATGVVQVTLDGRINTGLTRTDYFNWPAQAQADIAAHNPQVIVGMMGANDPQDFLGPPYVPYANAAAWRTQYAANCNLFFTILRSTGARVIWVTEPPMQDGALNAKVALVNQIQEQEAAKVGGIVVVKGSQVLAGPGGSFQTYLSNGQRLIAAREPDGIHITPGGSQIVGSAVIQAIRSQLGIPLP